MENSTNKQLKIRIEIKNQAFKDDLVGEIRRCLEDVCQQIGNNLTKQKIHDEDGNEVGEWEINKIKRRE